MLNREDPIFVLGAGRSGTTLMASLLSAHPRIAVPPETHFIKRALQWGPLTGGPNDFDQFWAAFSQWSRFKDLELDATDCRMAIEARGDYSFRAIFATLLDLYRRKTGKERVGEKTPGHWGFIGTLLDWYPRARIIAIQRDPRAVVASQIHCPWVTVTPANLSQGIFVNSRMTQIAAYARNWARVYDRAIPPFLANPRVMLVRYEDLVMNPEVVLREVCHFVREDFARSMLKRGEPATVAVPSGTTNHYGEKWRGWLTEHHRKATEPVSTNSLTKWKSQLGPSEVAVIEALCGEVMRRSGYDTTSSNFSRRAARAGARVLFTCESVERTARGSARRLIKRHPA
jgi:hypothetical protein